MENRIIAIVPAAGLGRRFGASERKTFVKLGGVPLLIHTLKRLHTENTVSEIIPVLRQEDIGQGFEMIREYGLHKIKQIAAGGRERQDSIYNALKLIEETGEDSNLKSLVLIHDGARPVIPEGTIEELLNEIKYVDGAAPGIPAKDTLKRISQDGIIISTVNREGIRGIQTPQAFSFKVIKRAYDAAYDRGFYATDDAALVEETGGKVKIIKGSPQNIKVTTPEDLEMVEYILTQKNQMKN
jgi:2-C-methyl-D-erythritol 4-phosphate cytidylyltransferase